MELFLLPIMLNIKPPQCTVLPLLLLSVQRVYWVLQSFSPSPPLPGYEVPYWEGAGKFYCWGCGTVSVCEPAG